MFSKFCKHGSRNLVNVEALSVTLKINQFPNLNQDFVMYQCYIHRIYFCTILLVHVISSTQENLIQTQSDPGLHCLSKRFSTYYDKSDDFLDTYCQMKRPRFYRLIQCCA